MAQRQLMVHIHGMKNASGEGAAYAWKVLERGGTVVANHSVRLAPQPGDPEESREMLEVLALSDAVDFLDYYCELTGHKGVIVVTDWEHLSELLVSDHPMPMDVKPEAISTVRQAYNEMDSAVVLCAEADNQARFMTWNILHECLPPWTPKAKDAGLPALGALDNDNNCEPEPPEDEERNAA